MNTKPNQGFSLWWLNPTYLFLLVMGVVILGAYLIPAASYESFYRVDKFINGDNIWYSILPAVFFVAGTMLARITTKGMAPTAVFEKSVLQREGFVRFCIGLLFVFTMFGYMAWFLIMVRNGLSVGLFLNVLRGEPGAIYQITHNFEMITGVTSFTNFGIPFTILAVYYMCLHRRLNYIPMLAVISMLTLFRAIFFSERLAILEIMLPALIVFIAMQLKSGRKLPLVRLYPLFAVGGLIVFFGLSEYFRSWTSYYVNIYPSFWEFMVTRFFGYYVTAMNTGTLYIEQLGFQSLPFPYFTWEWLWNFPGISGQAYQGAFGVAPGTELTNTLETLGNPEFNNPSGLLLPYHDYGLAGSLVYWLIIGFFSGLLYTWFQKGHTFGMILYPIWMVGIMEVPRYLYFSSGRFFPCWIVLLIFALVIHYNKRKIPSWQLVGGKSG